MIAVHLAYIGIGSNLQDPVGQVRAAFVALDSIVSTRVASRSSLYRSDPVGFADQPDYVNAVARVESGLDAARLLARLLAIERSTGRVRTRPNGPRTLDLDLLLFDDERIETGELVVPHPRMHERAFVMVPLAEIAPDATIPGRGRARDLLASLDSAAVFKLEAAAS